LNVILQQEKIYSPILLVILFFFLLQDKMHAQNRRGQTSACKAYFSLLVSALDFPEYLFTRNGTLFE
jgi:hypothetical protein